MTTLSWNSAGTSASQYDAIDPEPSLPGTGAATSAGPLTSTPDVDFGCCGMDAIVGFHNSRFGGQ